MKHILFALLALYMTSCNKDDNYNDQTNELEGNYKFISLTSNTSLDLNLDGIATTDFKTELSSFYEIYFSPVLRIKNSPNDYILGIVIPKPSFFPEYNDYDITYLSRSHEAFIKYIKKNNQLIYTTLNDEAYQIQNGSPIIKDIKILKNNRIQVDCKQKFYHHPDGWYDVELKRYL